ncbi:hypothetical protein L1D52_24245 [Vibrio brasiliensis]|uniref:hypothetical protein n=1 Tax=Vibrio brasiliensis TaxID=170652 RepID=UPI001EFDDB88|nr:hypothetical protein [Vibrio brasiliensis]MCG9785423.1 hypothetical protein [Vibrio brasiliensis]
MWRTSDKLSKGFIVAKNSDIRPEDLAKAGFTMRGGYFFLANLEKVRQRIREHFSDGTLKSSFIVTDESTTHQTIYRFESCPKGGYRFSGFPFLDVGELES